jgi:hypothetical protein
LSGCFGNALAEQNSRLAIARADVSWFHVRWGHRASVAGDAIGLLGRCAFWHESHSNPKLPVSHRVDLQSRSRIHFVVHLKRSLGFELWIGFIFLEGLMFHHHSLSGTMYALGKYSEGDNVPTFLVKTNNAVSANHEIFKKSEERPAKRFTKSECDSDNCVANSNMAKVTTFVPEDKSVPIVERRCLPAAQTLESSQSRKTPSKYMSTR